MVKEYFMSRALQLLLSIVASHSCTAGLKTEFLPKSPSNSGVALCGKTTQNGFVDFL